MQADKQEFLDLAKQRQIKRASKSSNVRVLEQAAVDKEKLIGDPHWDLFLQELQSFVDKSVASLKSLEEQIKSPLLVNPEEIQLIRNQIFVLTERVGTTKTIMNLPKDIIDQAEKASSQTHNQKE